MFSEDILKTLKIENMELAMPVVTVFGTIGASIEGHKGVLFFSSEEVRFRIKGRILSIKGQNITLSATSDKETVVSGIIEAVEYV